VRDQRDLSRPPSLHEDIFPSRADIFEDPQYRARGDIKITDSRAGAIQSAMAIQPNPIVL
jgi:hypothetical protein